MVSNVAMGMVSDDEESIYEYINAVRQGLSGGVLLLASVGTGGMLFSIHEGTVVGALCFMTMVVAAAVRFEQVCIENYRDKAVIRELTQTALSEQTIAESPEITLSE